MKTSILSFLAIASSASLIADCNPCCTPQPKDPICCECYTPAFNDLQCDLGLFLDVEFLYWYAHESDLVYGIKTEVEAISPSLSAATTSFLASPLKHRQVGSPWDPGVRVGLGLNISDDGWDLFSNWTYYATETHHSKSVPGFDQPPAIFSAVNNLIVPGTQAYIMPWLDQPSASLQNLFKTVTARWSFRLNQIDLELGRRYWLSSCFTMRPYLGLRGAWSRIHFSDLGLNNINGPSNLAVLGLGIVGINIYQSFKTTFINHFWGIGPVAGFQPAWFFTDTFSLFGNADMALLWGKSHCKRKVDNFASFTVPSASTLNSIGTNFEAKDWDNESRMQAILDVAIGLRYERDFCNSRFHFAFDASWEQHIWFNQVKRFKGYDSQQTSNAVSISGSLRPLTQYLGYNEHSSTISFGGPVVRVRFDF